MIQSPKRTRYLGAFAVDPTPTEPGQWWQNTTEGNMKFYLSGEIVVLGGTYSKTARVAADAFGKPKTNPPDVVDQDNLTLYSFKLNTDRATYKLLMPTDYDSGPFEISVIWTNDGDTDDNGKNVKWQVDYQVGEEGDVISGSHVNSPKSVEDTYESDLGWVEHHSDVMSIAEEDFEGKICVFLKLSSVTPTGTALTCDPHLIGVCFTYTAKRSVL